MSALAVANHILNRCDFLSTMKLQKLVFYSQALSFARRNRPLFDEDFQAWGNGPVLPSLFALHRGKFAIGKGDLSLPEDSVPEIMPKEDTELIDEIVEKLGELSGQQLSEKSHREDPWKIARGDLLPSQRSKAIIPKEAIQEFYCDEARIFDVSGLS